MISYAKQKLKTKQNINVRLGESKNMRKTPIIFSLLILLIMFAVPTMATITQDTASPPEGTTGVHVTRDFTVNIEGTNGLIDGNMTLYRAGVLTSTSTTITQQANGTQTFTLPTLDGYIEYTVYVHVNDSDNTPLNQSYNFTTGAKPLTLDTDNFGTAEILLLGIVITIITLGFLYSIVQDLKKPKVNTNKLVTKFIVVIFFIIIITVLASLI